MFFKPKKEKLIFIRLLEYGEEVGLSGTNHKNCEKWAFENGFISKTSEEEVTTENALLRELFSECFKHHSSLGGEGYVLKAEYFFRLLEYRELQEAQKASKTAKCNAYIAMIISALAIVISVFMAYRQLTTPITISDEQLNKILQRPIALEEQQIEAITNRPLKFDQKQLNEIINRPIKLNLEQLEIIKGWIEQRKSKPQKKANQ